MSPPANASLPSCRSRAANVPLLSQPGGIVSHVPRRMGPHASHGSVRQDRGVGRERADGVGHRDGIVAVESPQAVEPDDELCVTHRPDRPHGLEGPTPSDRQVALRHPANDGEDLGCASRVAAPRRSCLGLGQRRIEPNIGPDVERQGDDGRRRAEGRAIVDLDRNTARVLPNHPDDMAEPDVQASGEGGHEGARAVAERAADIAPCIVQPATVDDVEEDRQHAHPTRVAAAHRPGIAQDGVLGRAGEGLALQPRGDRHVDVGQGRHPAVGDRVLEPSAHRIGRASELVAGRRHPIPGARSDVEAAIDGPRERRWSQGRLHAQAVSVDRGIGSRR